MFGVHQAASGIDTETQRNRDQYEADSGSGQRLEPRVAVGVLLVGRFGAFAHREQHDDIGGEIGQRMDAVRDKRLRATQPADDDLHQRQREIGSNSHQGHAAGDA